MNECVPRGARRLKNDNTTHETLCNSLSQSVLTFILSFTPRSLFTWLTLDLCQKKVREVILLLRVCKREKSLEEKSPQRRNNSV